jgi:hypothetical protein
MLLRDGGVKVMDFGVASMRDAERTVTHRLAGTLACVAPELILGERADAHADLWSLGVVLYEMLAGRPPFSGPHEAAVMYRIVHEVPAEIGHAAPASMAVIRRLLSKAREERPGSAAEVSAMLAEGAAAPERTEGASWISRRGGRATAVAVGTLAGVVAIAWTAATIPPAPVSASRAEAMRHVEEGRGLMKGPPSAAAFLSAQQASALAVAADFTHAEARAYLAMAEIFGVEASRDTRPAARLQARLDAATALRQAPRLGLAWRVMGMVYQLEQKADSAVLMYRRATQLAPDDPEGHFGLGLALQLDGGVVDAVTAFERAVAPLRQLLAWPAGRDVSVPLLRVDPVRSAPGFEALLARGDR